MVWFCTYTTHVAATKVDINIMWCSCRHKIVFTYSPLNRNMSSNIGVPTSLTHSKTSPNGNGRFSVGKKKTHSHQLAWNISFKEWGWNKWVSPRHVVTWCNFIQRIKNVWCEDWKITNIGSKEEVTYTPYPIIKGRNSTCLTYQGYHMDMNEGKVHNEEIVIQSSLLYISREMIIEIFFGWARIIDIFKNNFNVTSNEEQTSSTKMENQYQA